MTNKLYERKSGILYIVGTPIGNLEDISVRVLNTLKEVDIIAAEDTRHTLKLLNHFDIKKKLISYHKDNELSSGKNIINLLQEGKNISLVSDAGMPGISDPGEELVKLAIKCNVKIIVIPGPTASIIGLILSGFNTKRFVFEGFLPNKKSLRKKRIEEMENEERTIILYESPHSLINTLNVLYEVIGNREVAILRELTKIYEESIRGSLEDVIKIVEKTNLKGEIVIIISGCENKKDDNNRKNLLSVNDHYNEYINDGLSKKDALKRVALDRNVPKKEIYNILFKK